MSKIVDLMAEPKSTCIGLIFRCKHMTFMTVRGFEQRTEMYLLKRMSCPGCVDCGGANEMLEEYAANGAVGLESTEHGALYTLQLTPLGGGPDHFGEYDIPDLDFVRYKAPTMEIADVGKGRRVKYIPDCAKGDPTDKRCELGCIKRMAVAIGGNDLPAAFVLYDNLDTKMTTGDEPYTAKRTRLDNLILI